MQRQQPEGMRYRTSTGPAHSAAAPLPALSDVPLGGPDITHAKPRPSGETGKALILAGERTVAAIASARKGHLNGSAMRRSYLRALVPIHAMVGDRPYEKLLFRKTRTDQTKADLAQADLADGAADTRLEAERAAGPVVYDGPIHAYVLDWVLSGLASDFRGYAFVDFRAGRGRTMLLASMRNFDRVIGFEYSQDNLDDAKLNISQFPRSLMTCRDVECWRGDGAGITIPKQPLVLFFPNAYRERFMALILSHISASYRLNPRRIYIILENPPKDPLAGQEDIFHEHKLPAVVRLKLKFFSPVALSAYRSLV
jgi:hypothetical protein